MGHRKKDRLFEVIERRRLPGRALRRGRRRPARRHRSRDGRRPRRHGVRALGAALRASCRASASRPGRCFAGNAALLGCCDLIIATPDASIGMGGPAMIEGGGLGVVDADEVGPFDVQVRNGVIDIAATDEADAVRLARHALSFFQGPVAAWEAPDQRALRDVVPENRRRAYDVHRADRGHRRHRFDARAAAALRARNGHRAGAHRGASGRDRRQQPDAPRRRDHERRRGQGGAVPAALRGVPRCPSSSSATRPASWSAPTRKNGARAPREPAVPRGRARSPCPS